jgi:hypothetical protein
MLSFKDQLENQQLAHVPEELKVRPRWVAWTYRRREDRKSKMPVDCRTGGPAVVTYPEIGVTFEQAVAFYRRRDLEGVGFIFGLTDPYTGVDLDSCRDPKTASLEPWAVEIVTTLATYCEVSPSGTGVKLFLKGKLPPGSGNRKGKVEMYSGNRFFTVTGDWVPSTPAAVEDRQEELMQVYERVFGTAGRRARTSAPPQASRALTDDEVVAKAMRAKNGKKFARLWEGDTDAYESVSEADLALCGLLAYWVGPDASRVEALFARSELGRREKWRSREDYRQRTVSQAVECQEKFYCPEEWERVLTRGASVTKSKQEEPRTDKKKDTVTAGGPAVEMKREQGVLMAGELARDKGDLPNWQAAFALARRLRALTTDNPEQFQEAVEHFCQVAGRPFEELWYDFLVCWPKVKSAEGDDVLGWAVARGKEEPYTPDPNPGALYQAVASTAWHLSTLTGGKPFWLPREPLALLLNANAMAMSRVVTLLVRYGVLKCVEEQYSYREGKAKEYEFTGPTAGLEGKDGP